MLKLTSIRPLDVLVPDKAASSGNRIELCGLASLERSQAQSNGSVGFIFHNLNDVTLKRSTTLYVVMRRPSVTC